MPEIKDVLDDVQREVKKFGDDVGSLRASMEKDLKSVRELAETASKAVADSPQFKKDLEALTAGVNEKWAGVEAALKAQADRADTLETAMKRLPVDGPKNGADPAKNALAFYEAKQAASGNLKFGSRPTVETIDIEGYKAWEKGFDTYLRASDERMVEAKALSIGSNPDGGYLVPTQTSSRIITKIFETSPIRQLATIETIGTSELLLPIDVNEMSTGWVGETQTRSETNTAQIGVEKIPVFEQYANPKATQAMLEDASINVEAWLGNKIADKLARTEATAFVSGTGVNQPRGILSYAAGTGRNLLPQYVTGAATAITADSIVALPFQIKAAYMSQGTWLMKRSTVASVMLLKDGDGQYLWRPMVQMGNPANVNGSGNGASGVVYSATLGGYPVALADDMPAVGAGNLAAAFGDFRRGYTVVDRLGITTLRDPYSSKPFVSFYSRKRVGGAVVDFDAIVLLKVST